jgi:hypothetical protein
MQEAKGEPYTPAENGFVFSEQQIQATLHLRNRNRVHDEALEYRETAA